MKGLELVVITGLSGAGKSTAIKAFEDFGFFCMDNIPPHLIPQVSKSFLKFEGKISRIAVVVDIRAGNFIKDFSMTIKELRDITDRVTVIYLDADDDILTLRFSSTRRRHPMGQYPNVSEAVAAERRYLEELKGQADRVIDTSSLSSHQLRRELATMFAEQSQKMAPLRITIVSFGYKTGIPHDADMVFDLRFLPNPFYVENLRALTGKDFQVVEYVENWPVTQEFIPKVIDLLEFLIPHFIKEGKSYLTIAFGCTGGRHRSVAIAERVLKYFREQGYEMYLKHRDMDRQGSGESLY